MAPLGSLTHVGSVTAHNAALYLVHLVLVLLASFLSDVQVVPGDGMSCCQDCGLVNCEVIADR